MEIISVSRRTDVPAFYTGWFMERVRAGKAAYRNPFGPGKFEVSLRPDDVHSLVFWSKDFRPLLPFLGELDCRGFKSYFLFTITALPKIFEPGVCSAAVAVNTFHHLASRYTPAHVQWRYDPIVISTVTDYLHHIRSFARLSSSLRGLTTRCYVSFVQMYRKSERNLGKLKPAVACSLPSQERRKWLVGVLAKLAARDGITIYACCNEELVGGAVRRGSCVDGELLGELFPDKPAINAIRSTRKGCRCVASRDIGAYDTCLHGCLYCYATANREVAAARRRLLDLRGEMLGVAPPLF